MIRREHASQPILSYGWKPTQADVGRPFGHKVPSLSDPARHAAFTLLGRSGIIVMLFTRSSAGALLSVGLQGGDGAAAALSICTTIFAVVIP